MKRAGKRTLSRTQQESGGTPERIPTMNRHAGCDLVWWAEHWNTKHPKIVDVLVSGNWDALIEILSTFYDQVKKEDSSFWQVVLHEAVTCGRCDVIEFLIRGGWRVDLDWLLSYAASFGENSVGTVEELCLLGAGGITDFWATCTKLDSQIAIYEILLKHNVVSPRMLFCEQKPSGENEIPQQQQQSLTFWLDISRDRCWKRGSWFSRFYRVGEDEHRDVLSLAELHAQNGAPVAVRPSLLERLPDAGPRVSALMAAALQPASLHSLCRKAVRRAGPKRHFKSWVTKGLGLPRRLSDYLCSSEA